MKKSIFILGLLFVVIVIHLFYQKHYIAYGACYKIPNIHCEFYRDAYVFFHSDDQLRRFFKINSNTQEYGRNLKHIEFDFTKYSYLIVYGAKVDKMYYSYKTTMFNDPSPSYAKARRYGKKCVFIDYSKKVDKGVYIYRMEKDTLLRGFAGF